MKTASQLAIMLCVLGALPACDSEQESDADANVVTFSDAGAPDASPTPDASTATSCTQAGDFNACANCFAMENPAGSNAYSQAIVSNCMCANECTQECTDQCADPNSLMDGDDCNSCLDTVTQNQMSGCVQGFAAECQGNQDCLSFAQSLQSCPM